MRTRALWLIGFAAAVGGRGCACTDDSQPAAPDPLPLDERLGPGEVRAGVIERESELIGGIGSEGRPGDLKLYNDRIAVIVGQPGLGRGYNPYGGGLVDADVVRPEGEQGASAFGEVIVAADLFILNGERIEVVDDGRDGGEARVRVHGKVDEMPLFSTFFAALFGAEPYPLEWRVDYVLAPDSHVLRCEYELFNPGRRPVDIGLPAAGFIFDAADPFVEGYGFAPPRSEGGGAYYGAATDEVSYLYGSTEDRLNVVITQSGVVFAALGDALTVRARERLRYTHRLVVGDGDLARTQAHWRAAAGVEPRTELRGRVVDDLGRSVEGARVHVLDPTRDDARNYVTRTRTDAEGRYVAEVPPGRYRLTAVTEGPTRSEDVEVEAMGGSTPVPDLSVATPGTLRYRVLDDAGRALPVKLSVKPLGGGRPQLPSAFGEVGLHFGLMRTVFAHAGEGEVVLPVGRYEVFVSRGGEYEVVTRTVDITAQATTELTATLERSVATPGWVSTDTHVHSQLSPDSPDTFEDKVRAMVVEGLEVPVSTEHEALGDFGPAIEALGLEDWMRGVVGSEVTTFVYGHFNAFPLVPDPSEVGNGRIDWYDKPPAETFAAVRANSGQPFLQVNHPRSPSIGGYLSAMGYDRETGAARRLDWSPDFDGLEVMNGCSAAGIGSEDVADWFSFLNQGRKVAGVGSTDNHRAESGNMGFPRTYLRVPDDDPRKVSDDVFREAFMEGRLVVSCGPFLTARIGEAQIGDTARLDGDLVRVDVHVGAPSWMDVDRVQLLVNGEVVKTHALEPADGTVRFEGTLTASVSAGADAWVVVATDGDRRHGVWARNRPSFAFTNPIFIDGDGDGEWTMR